MGNIFFFFFLPLHIFTSLSPTYIRESEIYIYIKICSTFTYTLVTLSFLFLYLSISLLSFLYTTLSINGAIDLLIKQPIVLSLTLSLVISLYFYATVNLTTKISFFLSNFPSYTPHSFFLLSLAKNHSCSNAFHLTLIKLSRLHVAGRYSSSVN